MTAYLSDFEAALAVDDPEDEEQERAALQSLIDSGLAWTLQGRVGRAAMAAIDDGRCALGPESRTDYYGNRIPARTEVEAGSLGSAEYVRAHGYEVIEP